jgi:hypothetical protein
MAAKNCHSGTLMSKNPVGIMIDKWLSKEKLK